MTIPLVDLHRQYLLLKSEIDGAIAQVIEKTAFIGFPANPFRKSFEEAFAKYIGARFCVGCANGTDSLEILMKAMEIGPGDEVLVPANTWISTSEAVSAVGARPVFVDVDPELFTINLDLIPKRLTSRTKAIIPVHLFGLPVDMVRLMEIARSAGIKVIEDCAQAHGATLNGRHVGTFGDAASFSFFPGKNLGAYGDAGGMTTDDPALAERIAMIANHGRLGKHDHQMEGRNSRLDGIQAAILKVKLPHLAKWVERRKAIAEQYSELLSHPKIGLPKEIPGASHAFHLFVIRTDSRNEVIARLNAIGVETGIHYPTALPFVSAYKDFGHCPADFPVAYHLMTRILSIPLFPEMENQEVHQIAAEVLAAHKSASPSQESRP